ncbi:MAG: glycosyltransferase family 2 protein [Gammaproteobacteria bacterium]|nr:glycosyltransferase family 2 protein [Gammaproteobacteria bacterium]
MTTGNYPALRHFLEIYRGDARLALLDTLLDSGKTVADTINIYTSAFPAIENNIWKTLPAEETITLFQSVFSEYETLIQKNIDETEDSRYKFYIVIPVADRPIHLQQCLNSILNLCELYQYGGKNRQHYNKIAVIVADDSRNKNSIKQHQKICERFSSDGLDTEYFGIKEQIEQIKKLGGSAHNLQQILGRYALQQNPDDFYHKGAAITRNIAYLRLDEIACSSGEKLIFYFIDSDQEFKIKIATDDGQKDIYAINYFYHLNEIFSRGHASILTGKVVGDPPVSPAVMAGNFQNDVIDFLQQIANNDAASSCHFHGETKVSDDAAYHDMADLFGFKKSAEPYQYSCTLKNSHSHLDCFNDFASKLNRFFDGEHPTRVTYFDYAGSLSDTIAARTIYTGNYAFKAECLKYFISFATLKLRMAGPVLGRIIKAELGDRFVSANLPMLHKRTTDETGESEFRPGVNREQEKIDLSDEFERQFFGDVMLFTIEQLSQAGYPEATLDRNTLESVLIETEQSLHKKYESKHHQIMERLEILKSVFNRDDCWWNNTADTTQARELIKNFINNIDHNFGANSQGHALINSEANQIKRHDEILQAILSYKNDRATWEALLK